MICATTAQARDWLGAFRVLMRSLTTLLTASILATSGATMSESLALEAPEGVWDEYPDIFFEPTDGDLFGQGRGLKGEDQQAGVPSLAIPEGRQSSDVGHTLSPQLGQEFILGHVAEFGGENRAFRGVASLVERDCHLLVAEHGCLQKCFRVLSIVCFDDESAVSWSFDVWAILSTDSSNLLLRPKNVDLPEREVTIGSLNNQKRTVRRQVRLKR